MDFHLPSSKVEYLHFTYIHGMEVIISMGTNSQCFSKTNIYPTLLSPCILWINHVPPMLIPTARPSRPPVSTAHPAFPSRQPACPSVPPVPSFPPACPSQPMGPPAYFCVNQCNSLDSIDFHSLPRKSKDTFQLGTQIDGACWI